jgi:hypothetical protein
MGGKEGSVASDGGVLFCGGTMRRITAAMRAKRTRRAVEKRLAEIPEGDGNIWFTRAGGKRPPLVMSPEELSAYKQKKMEGFDDLPKPLRDRLNEHNR